MTIVRPLGGKRILVLEDDFYLAKDEKAVLEDAGATVEGPYGTAFRAEALTGLNDIDSAVVDINLGQGPCFDFAYMLRARDVPFVFVTGYDAVTIPPDLSQVERLEKPIRPGEFVAAMVRLIPVEDDRPTQQ